MRVILAILTGAVLFSVGIPGCSKTPSNTIAGQIIKKISIVEAYALVQANSGKFDFVLLDVRTPSEFDDGHLSGAIMIDFGSANFKNEVGKLDKNKRYLVYCRTSHRSGLAVAEMKNLGFIEVYDMDGGIVAWQSAGYPTVK